VEVTAESLFFDQWTICSPCPETGAGEEDDVMIATAHTTRMGHLLLAILVLMLGTAVLTQAAAETLIVQGSTTFSRRLLEPYKSGIESDSKHELTVIPNKSMPGLIALMEGRAHMSMISASLKSEIEQLKKVFPGLAYDRLQAHSIVSTRIAIAIHPSNSIRKASLNQIRKALLGQISNWSELGGKDQAIRVVLVGGGGGVTTVVESELLNGKLPEGPHIIYVKSPVQLVQVIEQEIGALGFAQLTLTKQRGLPELITEAPIEQTLSLVTFGDPTPAMKAVIDAARRAAEKLM
jgi:phosphate transport system substrate-binding protein